MVIVVEHLDGDDVRIPGEKVGGLALQRDVVGQQAQFGRVRRVVGEEPEFGHQLLAEEGLLMVQEEAGEQA